jgi:phosphatidate cytidylyltransferase
MIINDLKARILTSIFLIPIVFFFIYQNIFFFNLFLLLIFLLTSYEWLKMNENKFFKLIGVIYISFSFYMAYLLRDNLGPNIFIFVILICISTDIGGYIFGKLFKGPKLIKISPNKTYAGMIGSFLFSLILGFIYLTYQKSFKSIDISNKFLEVSAPNYYLLFLLIILFISTMSQIGDLIISYFKRLAKIKDTGKILPGHGGLLDRIDGIIFALPASYLLINFIK